MGDGVRRLLSGVWLTAMKTTGEAPISRTKQEVIKEAKRVGESALYSAKGHFIAASAWRSLHLIVGLAMVVGTSVAAALVMSGFDQWLTVAGVLYIGVAVFSAVFTFLYPNERAGSHLIAGNHYDALTNRTRIFWTIQCWQNDSDAELLARVQALASEKDRLNLSSPQIPR